MSRVRQKIRVKSIVKIVLYMAVIILAAMLWNAYMYAPVKVAGGSMEPALTEGDIVIVDKLTYEAEDIKRYDMIVFPGDKNNNYIKRVIGLPKEKVEIKDSVIYINDERLKEYYGIYDENTVDLYKDVQPMILGEGEFFVMGDNRCHSIDSRSESVGVVKAEEILGVPVLRIWPWNGIGTLECQ